MEPPPPGAAVNYYLVLQAVFFNLLALRYVQDSRTGVQETSMCDNSHLVPHTTDKMVSIM